jgi:hypothetical protein
MQRIIAGILAPLVALLGFYLWGRAHPYTVSRSIEIAASPGRVWTVLSDLGSHARWNPEIAVVSGRAVKGAELTIRVHSTGGTATLHPTVETAEPGRELRWLEHYHDVSGLADGRRRFLIEPSGPGRVRFTQAETFRGIAVPFLHGTLRASCSGFDAMNAALKNRAESGE